MLSKSVVEYDFNVPEAGCEIASPLELNLPPWPDEQIEVPLEKGRRSYPEWVQLFVNAFIVPAYLKSNKPLESTSLLPVVTDPPSDCKGK